MRTAPEMGAAHHRTLVFTNMQNRQQGFLRQFDVTDLLHTFLTVFLFLQQFFLTADVTAVTLSQNVFTQLLNGCLLYTSCFARASLQ